jgi:bifunctional DNA-binding transcriptional regulator/antitoxin component of YhaV-PrlF toxin-antitoxin module
MGDTTHTLAVGANNNSDTGSVHVPADVQREQGICIGTEIEVTIEDIEGLFNSVAFENQQISGDRVSIPAEIMRKTDIEPGERYPVSFEVVEDDADAEAEQEADSLDDEEYAIPDDEVEDDESDSLEEMLNDLEDDSGTEQEAGVEDDEEEDKGLGELFG